MRLLVFFSFLFLVVSCENISSHDVQGSISDEIIVDSTIEQTIPEIPSQHLDSLTKTELTKKVRRWKNPQYDIRIRTSEEAICEWPSKNNDHIIIDSVGFKKFISEMNNRFISSNYSEEEANEIYTLLEKEPIGDGTYGMPMMDDDGIVPEKLPWPSYTPKTRIKIRKIDNSTFEAFYWYVGCGRTFVYLTFEINDKRDDISPIKDNSNSARWRLSFPC